MARKQTRSDRFWYDKHGRFVVWQKPNLLLWIWIAATFLNIVLPDSTIERGFSWLGGIAIFAWAILEVGWGANYFRRALGLGVILLFAVSRLI